MQTEYLITAKDFCEGHHIELSFIQLLEQYGLLKINIVEEQLYIPYDELPSLEKMIRLHFDLGINLEGIEAIIHLLQRIENLQQEVVQLRHKLKGYESDATSFVIQTG